MYYNTRPRTLDLTGKRFGFIVAQSPTNERQSSSVVWKCLCDCGNICYFSTRYLKQTKLRSCGCVSPHIKDLRGQIFGVLEVLRITNKRDKNRNVVWKCQCICGNEIELSSRSLLSGHAKSCGCKSKQKLIRSRHRKPNRTLSSVLGNYRCRARNKNISWELTEEDVRILFENNCHYCGAKPSNGCGDLIYNGIDRVDNSKGYTKDNTVSCCKICNLAKGTLTLQEWKEHIFKLYTYFNQKKSPLF